MDPGSPSSLRWGACLQGPVSCSMEMAITPELAIPHLARQDAAGVSDGGFNTAVLRTLMPCRLMVSCGQLGWTRLLRLALPSR